MPCFANKVKKKKKHETSYLTKASCIWINLYSKDQDKNQTERKEKKAMSFTAEEVSSKIGVSAIKIDNKTLETVNEISNKYPTKIFNLDMLDAKWKTFTFRNKIKNMNNITPSHLINFFKQIDEQCKQQQITMIIDDDTSLANSFVESKQEEIGDKRSMETSTATEENELKKIKTEDTNTDINQYQGGKIKEEAVERIGDDSVTFNANFKNKLKETVKGEDSLTNEEKVLKHLSYKIKKSSTSSKDVVIVNDKSTRENFKIFRESTSSLSKILDAQLSTKEHFHEKLELSDPTVQSQSAIFCVGRIVNDSVTELEPTFERSNLALETSRKTGIGRRIKIDVNNLKYGDLYLGQVVLCKGRNVTGEEFIIDEIVKSEKAINDEAMEDEEEAFENFKICTINGPLCSDSSLDYTLFANFVEKLNKTIKPDYLIINGPLLDITNKCISSGMIPPIITTLADGSEIIENVETLDDIFNKLVFPLLLKISTSTKIILTPHATDTLSVYSSYPQPSYEARLFEKMTNVYLLPNPGFISLNGVNFAINNIDIFKNMKTIDLSNDTKKNKFKLISDIMVENKNAYPLYPTIPSLNEDLGSSKRFKDMFDIPDTKFDDITKEGVIRLLGCTKQKLNKNINTHVSTSIPEDFLDGIHMIIHNSGFVPHLELLNQQGCTINTNGFYNGDKLGYYGEVHVSNTNIDVKIVKL